MSVKTGVVFLFLGLASCVQSAIVRFEPADPSQAKVLPQDVAIYQTHGPYTSFKEVGMISFSTEDSLVPDIYDQLRKDTAKAGAEAVIDLKIKDEVHEETRTVQKCENHEECNADGTGCVTQEECHDEDETDDVRTYMAVGTMITEGKLR